MPLNSVDPFPEVRDNAISQVGINSTYLNPIYMKEHQEQILVIHSTQLC